MPDQGVAGRAEQEPGQPATAVAADDDHLRVQRCLLRVPQQRRPGPVPHHVLPDGDVVVLLLPPGELLGQQRVVRPVLGGIEQRAAGEPLGGQVFPGVQGDQVGAAGDGFVERLPHRRVTTGRSVHAEQHRPVRVPGVLRDHRDRRQCVR